jgi:two-component system chemotaxis sensor kinase CheA
VYVDLKRVDQILKNLVSNAVKFTPSGHVKVVFSALSIQPSGVMEDDGAKALQIIVQDTGPGIPHEKQEAVFDAFCQADETIGKKYGGTGLGLSISRQLVRIMGGNIALESMEGRGSTFIVTIPGVFSAEDGAGDEAMDLLLQDRPEAAEQAELPVVCSAGLSDKKILIADDDMRNVYALIHCFENEGPEILVGKSGKECVEILERECDVDLVIMDVMMPDMGGFEAMKKIRGDDRFKDLPVICLTARAMKGDREKCLEAGATEYISKPVDMNSLMAIMKDLLRRSPENEIKEKL